MKKVYKFLIVIALIIALMILILGLPAGVGSVKMVSPEADIIARKLKNESETKDLLLRPGDKIGTEKPILRPTDEIGTEKMPISPTNTTPENERK
jgi:hypothetical protein